MQELASDPAFGPMPTTPDHALTKPSSENVRTAAASVGAPSGSTSVLHAPPRHASVAAHAASRVEPSARHVAELPAVAHHRSPAVPQATEGGGFGPTSPEEGAIALETGSWPVGGAPASHAATKTSAARAKRFESREDNGCSARTQQLLAFSIRVGKKPERIAGL